MELKDARKKATFHVARALEEGRRIGARTTVLTHLNHDILHARLEAELPPGFVLAHDGMRVRVRA